VLALGGELDHGPLAEVIAGRKGFPPKIAMCDESITQYICTSEIWRGLCGVGHLGFVAFAAVAPTIPVTASDRAPVARMLPSVIGSDLYRIIALRTAAIKGAREAGRRQGSR
jgi:hypothetical protein